MRLGCLHIHYFFDETAGQAMIREDEERFGFFPGLLLRAIFRHVPEAVAEGAQAPDEMSAPGAALSSSTTSPAPSACEQHVAGDEPASVRTCAAEVRMQIKRAERTRLLELAQRGFDDPASLSLDERRELAALYLKSVNAIN